MQERYSDEAKQTLENLAEKFLKFFTDSDNPESPEVEERRKQMNAQWRTYCKKMNLVPEAFETFETYSKGVIKEYHEQKTPAEVTE
jgi:hypothetical protein